MPKYPVQPLMYCPSLCNRLLWRHDEGMGIGLGDQADHRLASGQGGGGGGGQGQQRSDEGVAQGISPRRGLQTGGCGYGCCKHWAGR